MDETVLEEGIVLVAETVAEMVMGEAKIASEAETATVVEIHMVGATEIPMVRGTVMVVAETQPGMAMEDATRSVVEMCSAPVAESPTDMVEETTTEVQETLAVVTTMAAGVASTAAEMITVVVETAMEAVVHTEETTTPALVVEAVTVDERLLHLVVDRTTGARMVLDLVTAARVVVQ